MDDVENSAARLGLEFDQALGRSRSIVEELLERCAHAEIRATETSRSLISTWNRRVHLMQNRSMARAAADLMEG